MEEKEVPKIYAALDGVQQEIGGIAKDQKGYGYQFRGIDQVLNKLAPLFKKYKIIVRRDNVEATRTVRDVAAKKKEYVEVFIVADYVFVSLEDGSEVRSQGFGEGQDTSGGDKAASMATSNSYKYVIFEMFNIATEEQKDSDQVTAETAPKSTFDKPDAKKAGNTFRKKKPVVEDDDDI